MADAQRLEIPVAGVDCAQCARKVKDAIAGLPGIESVEVLLSSGKAVVRLNPDLVDLQKISGALEKVGHPVQQEISHAGEALLSGFTRRVLTLLGIVFGAVLFIVVIGEWLGFFEKITGYVPFVVGFAAVIVSGWPVFRNVLGAAWNLRITSHTLMTVGVCAALFIGQWATAAVIVFFMRIGDYTERFTTEGARRAVKDLAAMAPQDPTSPSRRPM